jgi:hypothetical protein
VDVSFEGSLLRALIVVGQGNGRVIDAKRHLHIVLYIEMGRLLRSRNDGDVMRPVTFRDSITGELARTLSEILNDIRDAKLCIRHRVGMSNVRNQFSNQQVDGHAILKPALQVTGAGVTLELA